MKTVERPKPGVYRRVPHECYHAWDAINHSVLHKMERTPAHARQAQLVPPEPTPALEFGQAVHLATLEPERFAQSYWKPPKLDRRRKADKEIWAQLEKEHAGQEALSEDVWDSIESIQRAVREHPIAGPLLREAAATELSFVWQDAATGLLCKGRIDALTRWKGWPVIVDLKTTQDASLGAFSRSCARYWYHSQAAFYLDGLDRLAHADRRFFFIAVEKAAPWAVYVHELGEADLEVGRIAARRWLREWLICEQGNLWPAYPVEIGKAALPGWAMNWGEGEDE